MRRPVRTLLGLAGLATLLASGWSLSQLPFAAPYRNRARDVVQRRLDPAALIEKAAEGLSTALSDARNLTDIMPVGDALALLRYVDSTDNLARIARVATIAGPEARARFAVLGKARVLRLTTRISELVLIMLALLTALAAQMLAFALWLIRRLISRHPYAARSPSTQF